MENELLQKLVDKSITKGDLLQKIKQDFDLLPIILSGISSSNAAIRYGCAKILMDLSEEFPEELYPYMDSFIDLRQQVSNPYLERYGYSRKSSKG